MDRQLEGSTVGHYQGNAAKINPPYPRERLNSLKNWSEKSEEIAWIMLFYGMKHKNERKSDLLSCKNNRITCIIYSIN